MRSTWVCALATALLCGGSATRAEEPEFTLEYRRVRPSGEEVEIRVDAAGVVTGTVRPVGATGPGEPVKLDGGLPLDPSLPVLLGVAGFWEGTAAAADEAGAAVVIRVRAGDRTRTHAGPEAELGANAPLARWAALCEVLTGAGLSLAQGWRARAAALEAQGKQDEAIAAALEGVARLPRAFAVRGPTPEGEIDFARRQLPPDRLATRVTEILDGEIRMVSAMLRRGEAARFAPDASLWPDDLHPEWPWNAQAPPAGWAAGRLAPPTEPNRGVRFARPDSWPAPEPDGGVDWAAIVGAGAALGTLRISASGPEEAVEVDLGWGECAEDAGWTERLERHAEKVGARVVRAVQYRLRTRRLIDVVSRRGGSVERWIVVQSGKQLALARLAGPLAAMQRLAPDLARFLASLEPQPAAAECAAEAVRELGLATDRTVRLEVPREWTERALPGAPARATFLDLAVPDSADQRLTLWGVGDTAQFDGAGFWRALHGPGSEAVPAGPPTSIVAIARVRSLGCGWADVLLAHVPFGDQTLPAVAFFLIGPERAVAGAVVCRKGDAGSISRARALVEQMAGSATAE